MVGSLVAFGSMNLALHDGLIIVAMFYTDLMRFMKNNSRFTLSNRLFVDFSHSVLSPMTEGYIV